MVACLLLVGVTVAAYSNSLRCAFVFDDGNDILKNASIKRLWPIWQVFMGDYGGKPKLHHRPVANVTLALNYATGGFETLHYHLTNLGTHVLAALTLFGIARRTLTLPGLGGRYGAAATPLAFAAAAAWALHPLQTQAVTFVIQRYESLAGMFYLVTLYCALRSDSSRHPRWWWAGSVSACLLAMGCKEVAVSAPLVVLLYDRAFLAGSFREAWRRRRGLYVGLAATWLWLAALLKFAGGRGTWAGFSLPVTWWEYGTSQLGVILHYLRLSFWPYPQVFDYGWPVPRTAAEIVPGAVVVGALLAATAYALVYWPKWGTLGAWFFLILAPTSSVMPIADLAFEHRMYLPLAAVVIVAVLAAHWGLQRLLASPRFPPWGRLWPRGKGDSHLLCDDQRFASVPAEGPCRQKVAVTFSAGAVPLVAVLTALGVATYVRNRVYQSEWSVWNDTVQKAPYNARAHFNLGYTLFMQGKAELALAHYQRAVQLNPRVPGTHCALAFFLDQQGRTDEAVAYYRRALQIDPRSTEAHHNLGLILRRQGQVDEAITHYRKALEINPDYADAHYNLGNVLCEEGRLDEAIGHYRSSLEIQPGVANVHFRLGSALAQQRKLEEAIVQYRKALEINPSFADASLFLNRALRMQREMQEGGHLWKVDRPFAPK